MLKVSKNGDRRVLFVCDIQNLFYGIREEFGREYRLDYTSLLDLIRRRYHPSELQAVAYVSLTDSVVHRVVRPLEQAGFEVSYRVSHECAAGGRSGTDIDALATVESIEKLDTFDLLVLASGDGDFSPMCQHIRNRGKAVEVVTFRTSLNRDVLKVVDGIYFLGEDVVFRSNGRAANAQA